MNIGENMAVDIKVGNIVELKKQHACGSKEFTVTRTGADVKFKCNNCGRIIMLDRETAEKRIKKFL